MEVWAKAATAISSKKETVSALHASALDNAAVMASTSVRIGNTVNRAALGRP